MALLIDSNVFIGLERRGLGIDDLRRIGPDEPTALASITASELLVGVYRSPPSRRTTARLVFVDAVCRRLPVLAFDLDVARTHARLWANLAAAGTPIGPADLLIAATALAHGYAVFTENAREFQRVPGLVVVQPTWPA